MDTLLNELSALFGRAFQACGLDPRFGAVLESQRPDLCQFQCNGAMPAAKAAGRPPRAVAEEVLAKLEETERFKDLSLAGPGFININLSDSELVRAARRMAGPDLGVPAPARKLKILLDFGGPNVAKPMHVGHLRSAVIGDCLRRLWLRLGHEVLADIHLGDWGTQMGLLIEGIREEQPGLPYFDPTYAGPYPPHSPVSLEDLERIYPRMSARAKADEAAAARARQATLELQQGRPGYVALWRHFVDVSVRALREDFQDLGVHFDLWLGESDARDEISSMLEDLGSRGLAVQSQGATVLELPDGMPPLLLRKSDGAFLYGTTDLATLRSRVRDLGAQRLLYVADKRQALHFQQVFAAARLAGYLGGAEAEHIGFGTVNGKDGKPFKTREGGAMRLRGLLDLAVAQAAQRMQENEVARELPEAERREVAKRVGYAAIKYADLMNHRAQDYVFDLERFTRFEGRTGPYLLYAAVRMRSIQRKADELGLQEGELLPPGDFERPLLLKLLLYPDALARTAAACEPHLLCDYAYGLADLFSAFYQGCNIIREPDAARRGSWLALTRLSSRVLEDALAVLGLDVPERM